LKIQHRFDFKKLTDLIFLLPLLPIFGLEFKDIYINSNQYYKSKEKGIPE